MLEQKIVNSFGSDEFFINKAIGWSLRNYSRTNLVWVINFIIKYRTLMNKLSIKEIFIIYSVACIFLIFKMDIIDNIQSYYKNIFYERVFRL